MSRHFLVENQRLAQAMDVVEAEAVRVPPSRPDEHDVVHEGAAVVRLRRHEDGVHPQTFDREPADGANPGAWIPGRPVDEVRVVLQRARRRRQHEVLVTDIGGAEDPPSPTGPGAPADQRSACEDAHLAGNLAEAGNRVSD
jgi:hypothetical protein